MLNKVHFIGKLPPPNGGVTIHCYRLYRQLQRAQDFQVSFTALTSSGEGLEGVKCQSFIKWFFKSLFVKPDYSVLHYQLNNLIGLLAIYFLSIVHGHLKIVFTIHAPTFFRRLDRNPILRYVIVGALKNYDALIVGNDALSQDLETYSINSNVYKIDAFLKPETDEGKELPSYLAEVFDSKVKTIVANGYNIVFREDNDHYGFNVLADLSKKLDKNNVEHKMIILISDINEPEYISKLFSDTPNVIIVSDQNIPGWKVISRADLMIRPSFSDISGFSLKEALVSDVYAIASDTVPRYDGVELYHYNDNEQLYNKVLRILNHNIKPQVVFEDNINHYKQLYIDLINKSY